MTGPDRDRDRDRDRTEMGRGGAGTSGGTGRSDHGRAGSQPRRGHSHRRGAGTDHQRTLAVWCAEWPVTAAGALPEERAVALRYGRVVSATAAARTAGVRNGQKRREAEAHAPGVSVIDVDPAVEARAFEAVAVTLTRLAPRIEVLRPGLALCETRGPSRYFGGDEALARAVRTAVSRVTDTEVGVGVADGAYAATQAARAGRRGEGVLVVAPGATPEFLAPLPLGALGDVELAALLGRLGLRTLGQFAALPEGDVLGRFGPHGHRAWRLAGGLPPRPLAPAAPPEDLSVAIEFDPPAERVDTAAFAARGLAADLHERLAARGLACTRLLVEATTTDGQEHARLWRSEDRFSASATAERLRWQLEGWLLEHRRGHGERGRPPRPTPGRRHDGDRTDRVGGGRGVPGVPGVPGDRGSRGDRGERGDQGDLDDFEVAQAAAPADATLALASLRLVPDEVIPDQGRQLGFWSGDVEADDRAARALARIQGILGPDGVTTAVLVGGRGPGDQVRLVPWGDPRDLPDAADLPGTGGSAQVRGKAKEVAPWPGRIGGVQPVLIPVTRPEVALRDQHNRPVTVSGRGLVSAPPARVVIDGQHRTVTSWAGPWPYEERWWDPAGRSRQARLQLTTDDGAAYLLTVRNQHWHIEAGYD